MNSSSERSWSVVVTGGASGLGRAAVERFHKQGAYVVIADLERSSGADLAQSLGDGAAFSICDVCRPEEVERSVRLAAEAAPLRVAIAAAGIGPPAKIFDENGPISAERVRSTFEVNLLGTYNLVSFAAHAMAANEVVDGDRGVILLTASIAAYDGQIGLTAYAASKGGVVSMTLPAARELARYAIRVVAVAPGLFDTPLLASMPEKARQSTAAQTPHPSRLGAPDEYALLLEQIVASKMLNGEVIRLDGAIRMAPK